MKKKKEEEEEEEVSACGYCLHCMKNLRSFRVTGKKGRLTCLQKDDYKMLKTHRKIYFGETYFFFVEKNLNDEKNDTKVPSLKSLRLAMNQRRNDLKKESIFT